ncbi:MAG: hypothetical protein JWM62_2891 [Frankiales bacterium]|nr:hypothetical protein [Frankiales bacterium]
MTATRLLLSATALELVRQRALPAPLALPPGFALEPTGGGSTDEAVALLQQAGVALPVAGGDWSVHPALADDLLVLAAPEVAVTVRAARPDLEVHACLALSGPRGAGLLRTGDTAVQLSAFSSVDLAAELARVVPAPIGQQASGEVEEVPLDVLLDGTGSRLRGRSTGTLHATVFAGPRPDRAGGLVGSVEWVWDGHGWTGLEALPSRAGRPWVRLVPVVPADLGAWVAALVARAAA